MKLTLTTIVLAASSLRFHGLRHSEDALRLPSFAGFRRSATKFADADQIVDDSAQDRWSDSLERDVSSAATSWWRRG